MPSDRDVERLRQLSTADLSVDENGRYTVQQSGRAREPHGVSAATIFLLFVNVLTTLGGLAVLCAAAYAYVQYNSVFSGVLSQNSVVGGMVAGVLIAVVSVVGIMGTTNQDIRVLAAYGLVQFLLFVALLTVLGLLVTYINVIEQVSSGTLQFLDSQQVDVSDYLLSSYMACCVLDPKMCSDTSCVDTQFCVPVTFCASSDSFSNATSQFSSAACNDTVSVEPCFYGSYGADASNPPQAVPVELCSALASAGVVGPVGSGGSACGGGGFTAPADYLASLYDFIHDDVQWAYYGFGALAALLFLELVACAFLMRFYYRLEHGLIDLSSPAPQVSMGGSAPPTPSKKAGRLGDVPVAKPMIEDSFEYTQEDLRRMNDGGSDGVRSSRGASLSGFGGVRSSAGDFETQLRPQSSRSIGSPSQGGSGTLRPLPPGGGDDVSTRSRGPSRQGAPPALGSDGARPLSVRSSASEGSGFGSPAPVDALRARGPSNAARTITAPSFTEQPTNVPF